jgi:hypothetical protein
MERDSQLVNPNWKRPDDWPYEADFDSSAWKRRMREIQNEVQLRREKFGFVTCPQCETGHTGKTLSCRGCEYKANSESMVFGTPLKKIER